jgi:putative ABC transport system permease protein
LETRSNSTVTVAIAQINRSILESFRSTVDTVSGKADLNVAAGPTGFPEEILEQVRAVPGVFKAAGALSQVARMPGEHGGSLYVLAVDLGDDGYFREYTSAEGSPQIEDGLALLNTPGAIFVSERFAREHGKKLGDTFSLLTSGGAKEFTIKALLKEDGPVKAFGGAFGVMDIFAAQAAFEKDRKLDRIDVAVQKGVEPETVKAALAKALGPSFDVERPQRRGQSVQNMLRTFQTTLNLGSAVALIVGVFLVYNTVSISVVQRRREIGTLRALGTSGAAIRGLFALEAGVLGALGTALGVPFGTLVSQQALRGASDTISSIYVQVHASKVELKPADIVVAVLLGIGGSVFAALRPAGHAARIQPVEALRRDVAAGAGPVSLKSLPTLVGLGLFALVVPLMHLPPPVENLPLGGYLAIFAVMMGTSLLTPFLLRQARALFSAPAQALFGIAGRLAADNFSRAPGRSAVPVAALAIGVSMTVEMGGYISSFSRAADHWIDQSVPADVFVTSSYQFAGTRNTPMGPALGLELDKLEGVRAVDRVRLLHVDYSNLNIFLLSLDPDIYFERARVTFLQGDPETAVQKVKDGEVIISENLSKRRGLNAGDRIELKTPTGMKSYPIAAVSLDYTSDQGLVAMSRDRFIADFNDQQVDTYELYLHPGTDIETIRRTVLERWGKAYDLFALSNAEVRTQSKKLIDDAFSITYAIEFAAILLALLGVINTLLAAVLDRTRELGLLRAVGATREQVVKSIAAEAAMMGIAGGTLGILSGILLESIVITSVGEQATGWTFPMRVPYGLALQMSIAATVAAVVAGLYPAVRAARLDVVEALSYE